MRNQDRTNSVRVRSQSKWLPRFMSSLNSRLLIPRRGFVSLVAMTELLLVSCVVSGLVMMIPAIRPALCPASDETEAESTVEHRVPNLVVARLCNEAWFQSGSSKLIRCDLENHTND